MEALLFGGMVMVRISAHLCGKSSPTPTKSRLLTRLGSWVCFPLLQQENWRPQSHPISACPISPCKAMSFASVMEKHPDFQSHSSICCLRNAVTSSISSILCCLRTLVGAKNDSFFLFGSLPFSWQTKIDFVPQGCRKLKWKQLILILATISVH